MILLPSRPFLQAMLLVTILSSGRSFTNATGCNGVCGDGFVKKTFTAVPNGGPSLTMKGSDAVSEKDGTTIDVKLEKETEYTFTFTSQSPGNGCGVCNITLGCGVEFKLIAPDEYQTQTYGTDWVKGGAFTATKADKDSPVKPSGFMVRLTKDEEDDGGDDTGGGPPGGGPPGGPPGGSPGGGAGSSPPSFIRNPSLPLNPPTLVPPQANFEIPLGKIGMGPGGTAPFRSAGILSWRGQLAAGLAMPSRLEYRAISEVKADPRISWADVTPLVGGAVERHLVTPTRLFRITGFNGATPDSPINYSNALKTYVREYIRATDAETLAITLSKPIVSWYQVFPDGTTSIRILSSVNGLQSGTLLSSPTSNELVIDDGFHSVSIIVGWQIDSTFKQQKIEKRGGIAISRREDHYEFIAGEAKLVKEVQYPDPATNSFSLATDYDYYRPSATLPQGTPPGSLRWVSYPDGNWTFYRRSLGNLVTFSPFNSETALDPTNTNQAAIPITFAGGSGRFRKTVSDVSATKEYVSTDLGGGIVGDMLVSQSSGTSSGNSPVANLDGGQDAVLPDGVPLVMSSNEISYLSGIPISSPDRWLAGKTVLSWTDDGSASFHEYAKVGGTVTKTVTSGVVNSDSSGAKIVGEMRFHIVTNQSDQTITVANPQGLSSTEWLFHTGSGFTRAKLEVYSYNPDGSYASTTTNGIITHQTTRPDAYTTVEKDARGITTTTVINSQQETVSRSLAAGGGVPAQITSYETIGLRSTVRQNGFLVSETLADGVGRTVQTKDAMSITTGYSFPPSGGGGMVSLETAPGGITRRTENYVDGRTKSISGSGVVAEFHSYDVQEIAGAVKITSSHSVGSSIAHTARVTVEEFDNVRGSLVSVTKPSPAGGMVVTQYDRYSDRLFAEITSTVDTTPVVLSRRLYSDSISNLTATQAQLIPGSVSFQGDDLNNDNFLTLGSLDRYTKQEWSYVLENGEIFKKTLSHRYPTSSEIDKLTTQSWQGLSMVPINQTTYKQSRKAIDPSGRTVTHTTTVDPTSATVVTVVDDSATSGADSTATEVNGYTTSVQRAGFTKSESFQYDGFGRLIRATDSRGAASRTMNNNFQVDKIIDHMGRETLYRYYPSNVKNAGKMQKVIHPGGAETETVYSDRGELQETKGSAEYRQVFGYNVYGDKVTLETFGTVTSLTRWVPQLSTGLLQEKRYNDATGTGVGYLLEYTPDAKIAKRTTARNAITSYTYDSATRDLSFVTYSGVADASTPDVSYLKYDKLGRPGMIKETLGTIVNTQGLIYKPHSGAVSTVYGSAIGTPTTAGASHVWLPFVSVLQTNDDLFGRPTGFEMKVNTTIKARQSYEYDSLSRLQKVSSDELFAEVGYVEGTGILRQQTIKVKTGGQVLHDRRLAVDMLGRTEGVVNRAPTAGLGSPLTTIASVGHLYDPAGRRKNANREDGTSWQYDYNSRSEIEGATKKTASGTTVPGLGFTYAFDGIGNRNSASIGSDSHSTSLSYTPNALNQYSVLTHSGNFWSLVRSDAPVTATATAGASIVGITQVSNFYGAKVTVLNSSSGKFVKTTFMRNGVAVAGGIDTWTPAATYSPIHDLDGNLTNDGRWIYSWDGESRLISMTPAATAIANGAPNIEVSFAYDYASRRIGKTVVDKRVVPNITRHFSFAYDGWNPVAEWERTGTTLSLKHTHLWGLDLGSSGTAEAGTSANFQQAGGVAGLIASSYHNPSTRDHFIPGYDANGNIIAWTSGTGALVKKIDYDAFGNEVIAENFGDVTKLPAFGFSTKIKDRETGLSYYGYRYYDPVTGRWISKDSIEEEGGINLYGFVGNDGVNRLDRLGLKEITSITVKRKHVKWLALLKENLGKKSTGADIYGHWWLDIDGSESYGWWPADPVGLAGTLSGVPGILNGQGYFGGSATRDVHHPDSGDEEFHPKQVGMFGSYILRQKLEYGSGKAKLCCEASVTEIKDCIRKFAASYSGNWSYPLGQNCHSFQRGALDACCLKE